MDVLGGDREALRRSVADLSGDLERLQRAARQQSKRVAEVSARVGRQKLQAERPAVKKLAAELVSALVVASEAAARLEEAVHATEAEA